jgi:hypothetical protein
LRQRIESTAEFECAHALEVFALEKNLGTELAVQGGRLQNRCTVGHTGQPPSGG